MDVLQLLILFTKSLLYLAEMYVQMVVCALLRPALMKSNIILKQSLASFTHNFLLTLFYFLLCRMR